MTHQAIEHYSEWDSYDLYNAALNDTGKDDSFRKWVVMTLKERGGNDDLIYSLAVNFA